MEESEIKSFDDNYIDQNLNNVIKFDVLKIDSTIKNQNSYIEDENKFEFCLEYNPDIESEQDPKIDYPKYISKIKTDSSEYLGILSKYLKKEGYGYNIFKNGNEYFGQWNKDKKEGYGIYFFKENNYDEDSKIKQIYIGEFTNNIKSGEGVYFKIKNFYEEKKDDILIPFDFSMAIGNFKDDYFYKGIIYNSVEGKRKIYKGKIIDEKKNDDNAEIYEDDNKIFFGIIKDNIMLEGRIIIMNEGEKEAGYYFTKKDNNGDIEFDYNKREREDYKFIQKLIQLNDIFDYEKIQDLFVNVMKIRERCIGPDNFDYIKNINYDVDIKQELKDQYGKYLYC